MEQWVCYNTSAVNIPGISPLPQHGVFHFIQENNTAGLQGELGEMYLKL